MQVTICPEPFNPWSEIIRYQDSMVNDGQHGATAVFVGTMRDHNEGANVVQMTLEHYPQMVQKHLESLCEQACRQWNIIDGLVMHRVGEIRPGAPIVLVAVWAAHRADAYAANRFIMEDLKSKAPFWKKEWLSDGERWVEKNTPG